MKNIQTQHAKILGRQKRKTHIRKPSKDKIVKFAALGIMPHRKRAPITKENASTDKSMPNHKHRGDPRWYEKLFPPPKVKKKKLKAKS